MSTIDHDARQDDAMSHTMLASSRHAAEPSTTWSQASDISADAAARLHEILNEHQETNHDRFGSVSNQIDSIAVSLRSDVASADAVAAAANAQAAALDVIRRQPGVDPVTVGAAVALIHAQTAALLQLDVAVHARAESAMDEARSVRTPAADGQPIVDPTEVRAALSGAQESVERLTAEIRAIVENHSNRPAEFRLHYSSATPLAVSPEGVVTLFVGPDQKSGSILATVGQDEVRVSFSRTADGHVTWEGAVNGNIHPAESRQTQAASERDATTRSNDVFTYKVSKTVPERENAHRSEHERNWDARAGGEIQGKGVVGHALVDGAARLEGQFHDKNRTTDMEKERRPIDQTAIEITVRLEARAAEILRSRR